MAEQERSHNMHEITSAVQAQNLLKENPAGQAAQRSGQIDFQTVMEQQKTGGSVPMDAIFEAAGERYSISPKLLRAVAKAESGFNPRARSGAGAMGVMQLMPATARSLGVTDPYDPWQNIMGGAKYLKEKLDQFYTTTVEYVFDQFERTGTLKNFENVGVEGGAGFCRPDGADRPLSGGPLYGGKSRSGWQVQSPGTGLAFGHGSFKQRLWQNIRSGGPLRPGSGWGA